MINYVVLAMFVVGIGLNGHNQKYAEDRVFFIVWTFFAVIQVLYMKGYV